MATLKLYNDITARGLVSGITNSVPFSLPYLYQGDIIPIQFSALIHTQTWPISNPFEVFDTDRYTLKLGLYKSDGTELAAQNTWTASADKQSYSAQLALNTAAITTAMGTGTSITAVRFEAELSESDGSITTGFQIEVTIARSYITNATVAPPAGEVAAVQSWVNGLFIPQAIPNGFRLRIPNEAGTYATEIYTDTDGTLKTNTIAL